MNRATYTLFLDFGSGFEDFSDRIILSEGYTPRLCIGREGKHEIQTVRVRLHRSAGLGARLATTTDDHIPARFLRNGIPVMTGVVRPYNTSKAALNRMEAITLTILDRSATLDQYVFESRRWTNLVLIDCTDLSHSLVHLLFAEAGVDPSEVLVGFDRSEVIPCYALSNGDYIGSRIQEVLYEYGLTYRATADGRFLIIDIAQDVIIAATTIRTEDLRTEFSMTRSDSSQKGSIVRWYPVLSKTSTPIFEYETAEGGEPIPGGGVFPPLSDVQGYRLPYDISELTDGKLLAIANASVVYEPATLQVTKHTEFGSDDCSAYLRSTVTSGQTVASFAVIADVWYQGRTYSQQIVPGPKPKTYTAKVISDAGSAQRLARILSLRQTCGQQSYSFDSVVSMDPGQIVRVIEDKVSFLDVTLRILSREFDATTSLYRYTSEGTAAIDLTTTVEGIESAENALGKPRKGDAGPRGKSYRVEIESTEGLLFRPGSQYTRMIAHIYDDTGEITGSVSPSNLAWIRKSQSAAGDAAWNTAHASGYKEIELTPADFYGSTSFKCKYEEVI
ncbi:MAG: hypothetical protein JEY71_11955 [Sphaerochaeta sp.]|nr:hypothetical protein [Sphaerochaeta sp.]